MKTATCKIFERSPLRYSVVRSFTCLALHNIVHSRITSGKRMDELLQRLYEGNQISSVVADRAKVQYVGLCSRAASDLRDAFEGYVVENERLEYSGDEPMEFQRWERKCREKSKQRIRGPKRYSTSISEDLKGILLPAENIIDC